MSWILISSGLSLCFNDSWKYLDARCTFYILPQIQHWQAGRFHLLGHITSTETWYTFISCHKFSIGLASGLLGGFSATWCVLEIVVLHELVVRRIFCSNEREQALLKYVYVEIGVYNPFKHTDCGWSRPTYSCPNINLHGMLWTRLVPRFLLTTKLAVGLQLHTCLVWPDNVFERYG